MEGPPYKCDYGDVVNIDGVARAVVVTTVIDGTVEYVVSGTVT